jgi:phage shock protein PspC (stress-responsive transcriptional regulator)
MLSRMDETPDDPTASDDPWMSGESSMGSESSMGEEPAPETPAAEATGAERTGTEHTAQGTAHRRLERAPSDRILAGVAAGVANYFGLDVSLVRVGFVVLSLFGGFGVVLYAAGWILLPEPGRSAPAADFLNGSKWRTLLVVVVAFGVGILTLSIIARGPWGFSWGAGRALGWLIVVALIGLLVLRGIRPNVGRGRILRRTGLGILAIVVLAVAGTICTEVVSGVPFRGGIGSRNWRPTSIQQVSPTYRSAVGNMTVDLSDVAFPDKVVHLTASVGIGHLVVDVPTGVQVSISARTGIGNVVYGPGGLASFVKGGGTTPTSGAVLVIDAEAGIGEVELDRVPAAASSSPVAL